MTTTKQILRLNQQVNLNDLEHVSLVARCAEALGQNPYDRYTSLWFAFRSYLFNCSESDSVYLYVGHTVDDLVAIATNGATGDPAIGDEYAEAYNEAYTEEQVSIR